MSNILKYAMNQEDINLSLNYINNSMIINIEDYGDKFNPMESKVPVIVKSVDDMLIGGLGIHIVKQLAKRINYHRVGGHNILQVIIEAAIKNKRQEV
ncbi:MAG TPA: ATP-binding protein [Victivallales bacterium]|nr:ATP-binding protein [Victivallales bacterium]